jgi:hypothetical protein
MCSISLPNYILAYKQAQESNQNFKNKAETRESYYYYSSVKKLDFVSPIPLLHLLEMQDDHLGYSPKSCWQRIFGRSCSGVRDVSNTITDIQNLSDSELKKINRMQMSHINEKDLSKLSRRQIQIFSPIQLSALPIQKLSKVICKLRLKQLSISFASRPLEEVKVMGKTMNSSGFMKKLNVTLDQYKTENSFSIDNFISLSPLEFKIALSLLPKNLKKEVLSSINLWSTEQLEVVFPVLNKQEQFSLIANSVPTQKHVIQSCLTDTQSKEILLEGKKELRSTLDKVKEVFLELNFSETATSLEGIHHYFDTIENVKEEFFKELKKIGDVFRLVNWKRNFEALTEEIEVAKNRINAYFELLKNNNIKQME